MAAVSGQGTTFNLPNYHGELTSVSPTETPFLSAIGGLGGAKFATSIDFEWQTIDRRASTANNAALEGANAPTAGERSRTQVKNCVEIHHSAIELSYSKMAATGNFAGVNVAPQWDDRLIDELALQTQAELESMAVDVEKSFLSGVYARPADNATVRKTAGVLSVAGTVSANGGTNRALTSDILNAHIQAMFDAGAKLPEASTVFIVGSAQNTNLTKVYAAASTLSAPVRDRNIAGMNINTVVTPFGTFGVLVDRWMPANQIATVDLSVCYPVFLQIPLSNGGVGTLFVEELAKVGSARKFQLYGEIGLEYGAPTAHGLLKDLT